MTWYDGLMIALIVVGAVQGAWRGLAWQIAPIASLIVGYFTAFPASEKIAHFFGNEAPTNRWIAMLVVYLAVSFAIHLVARIFRESIQKLRMEAFDRHLGALLGGVKGALLCLVITFFAVGLSDKSRDFVLRTPSGELAGYVMHQVEPVLPAEARDLLAPYIAGLPTTRPEFLDVPQRWDVPFVTDSNDRPQIKKPDPEQPPASRRRPSAFADSQDSTDAKKPSRSPFVDEILRMSAEEIQRQATRR